MKKTYSFLLGAGILAASLGLASSCTKEDGTDTEFKKIVDNIFSDLKQGWFDPTDPDKGEKTEELEDDIVVDDDTTDPVSTTSVDLTPQLPPIGDQGQYGTCVAWAVGYNLRTFLYAVDKKLSKSQLENKSNQFSPKDLFLSISNSNKGSDCNGTNFEYALDVLVNKGITTLDIAPYTNMGKCSQSPDASWASSAKKIANYREIDFTSPEKLKSYLAQKRVIVFGAKLGDKFMGTKDATVLKGPETYAYAGQHAYHAMLLSGYDDAKKAFRVVNSWNTSWGDNGYVWVDYNFFCGLDASGNKVGEDSQFAFCAFIGNETNGAAAKPNTDGTGEVAGIDLLAGNLEDAPDKTDNPRDRIVTYNVWNIGTQSVPKEKDWAITYLIYNAYDAKDYRILFYDYYSNDYSVCPATDTECTETYGKLMYQTSPKPFMPAVDPLFNYWNYVDVAAGRSVSYDAVTKEDLGFEFAITLPSNLNGQYYMVMIADAYNKVEEAREDNNYMYITDAAGGRITVKDGVMQETPAKPDPLKRGKSLAAGNSPKPTVAEGAHKNAYTPEEISAFLLQEQKSGRLVQRLKSDRNYVTASEGRGKRLVRK